MTEALHRLSAVDAAARIRAGEISSEEVVRSCLDRIAAREDDVRAWTYLDPELAVRQARQQDAREPSGPLHGVPVGIKDIMDTADQTTEYGSPIYAGHRPARDAVCVALLRAAGAVILGKTVTTEFALFHPGPTANPHDHSRTPGGSSSGSAAAVADGMVPLALGTQTAGSIVRPASFCGVFGLKPTFGSIDLGGVKAVAPSLDTLGAFARSAEDLGLCTGVLQDRSVGTLPELDRPRLGFARTYEWDRLEPSTRATLEALVGRLDGVAHVEEVTLPPDFAGLVEAQDRLMTREAAEALGSEYENYAQRLSVSLRERLEAGARLTDADRDDALKLVDRCRRQLEGVFADRDFLLAPSVLGEAPEGLDATGDPLLCRLWTLLGSPTLSVPGLRGPSGLPLGVQVVAPHGREDLALAAGRWLAGYLEAAPAVTP